MLFNLFGKKEDKVANAIFLDKTYMSTTAKMNACAELAKKEPNTVFISWFSNTTQQFKDFFTQHQLDAAKIIEARHLHSAMLQHKNPVFVEHHPLHTKELELIKNWEQKNILAFSAMDEPLFKHFGSEKMLPLMKMLGMKEDEVIEHAMVSKSILKGQEKIASLVSAEQPANSQEEWMEKNLK